MTSEFEGKIALVTGANRGLGYETARQLGKLGFTVLLGGRDFAKVAAAKKKLEREGSAVAIPVHLDLAAPTTMEATAKTLEDRFGKLDVLVNNAAINLESGPSPDAEWLMSKTPAEWIEESFRINVVAVHRLTQLLMPYLMKSKGARIVNVSSVLGSLALHADPKSPTYSFQAPSYDLSKTALNAYTVHLAYELRETPHKVNSAHPGWVKTEMGGPNAPMEVEVGARTMVQLATLPPDGPSGGFFHAGEAIPW